ncbi:MAG: UDP-glucose 4-epimerase GalE [Planctomycetota bacterium]|nr:MAG: UDP-glucose 4-epimerase GalE [Planctomycetota bacterium]
MSANAAPKLSADAPVRPSGRVLVVGGAGYIGSHAVRCLERLGVDVVVLDNLSTGHREHVRGAFEQVDLADRAALARVFEQHRPAAVIHFAAKCYVGESVHKPADYYRENVGNTWNLLEAMRAAGCRDIVFSSTCATYGEPREVPIPDDHPQAPINPYGRTKLHMEHMMDDYATAYGMRYAALRYFNAAGASPDGDLGERHEPETHLVPLVLQVALGTRADIAVFGDDYPTPDGTCVRDYIHVDDLADAHVRALAWLQAGGARIACNLGTGSGYSVREVIECARRVTGRPIPTRIAPRRAGDPARLVSGGKIAFDVLGWKPRKAALDAIVRDAWAFHSAHAPH